MPAAWAGCLTSTAHWATATCLPCAWVWSCHMVLGSLGLLCCCCCLSLPAHLPLPYACLLYRLLGFCLPFATASCTLMDYHLMPAI